MELEQAVEDIIQNTIPESEGTKEKKLHKSKTFKYDIFKDLSQQKVNATFGQLAEIPTFRQQMRYGLSETVKDQGWKITEANNV